jgi:geranylgeranyl pyrophosphate synthase
MAKRPVLTEAIIKSLKAGERSKKVFDSLGLYLEISPGGGKWWRLKYRFAGKEKRLSLGVYPDVRLKEARKRRDDMRRLIREGWDPSHRRREARSSKSESTARGGEGDPIEHSVIDLGLHGKAHLTFSGHRSVPKVERGLIEDPLIGPLEEFVTRPGKHVRAHLVYCCYSLAGGDRDSSLERQALLQKIASWVEWLHAGSLVIDDIQDHSESRRGRPALHVLMGQSAAINAANWLYFWPTLLLRTGVISPSLELEIYRVYHETMTRAHYGQSLDLHFDMCSVPKDRAQSISLTAIGLKTGALMEMCSELGAVVAGADEGTRKFLSEFGFEFGMALQKFNDLKDFKPEVIHGSFEQGSLTRPSWVWATAARILDDVEFKEFQNGIARRLMTCGQRERAVAEARIQAESSLQANLKQLEQYFRNGSALKKVRDLASNIMEAYR